MAVLPRTSLLTPVPGEAAVQGCTTSTLSVVAIAIGITFTITVLMLKFVPVWGFLRLLSVLAIERLNRCRKNREKSKSSSSSSHAATNSGTQLAGQSMTILPPPTSVPASDVPVSHKIAPRHPLPQNILPYVPLPQNDFLHISPPRPDISPDEGQREETQQPTLSEQWASMWRQSPSPLKLERKDAAATGSKNSSGKRTVQDLTIPTDGFLTAAPAHVDISQNPMTKFGSSSAIVHPLEVERNLNAVFFPQFDSSSRGPGSGQRAPSSRMTGPLQPARKFWKVPIEWGPEESQSNPLNGRIISVIDSTPHQWETTMGSDKPIFGAECDVSETPRKLRWPGHYVPEMVEVGSGMARQIHAGSLSAGVHAPDARLQHCSKGKCPALVGTSETRCDDVHSLEPDIDHGYSLDDLAFPTLNGVGSLKWNRMDLSCTQVIAASRCQQVKYFAKFKGPDADQLSKNAAPATWMVNPRHTSQNDQDSPVDSLYADPSYIPRISGRKVAESLPPASTESSITSAGTEGSSWSTSPASFSSASSISKCEQLEPVVLRSPEACTASSLAPPPQKSPEAIVLLVKYACPICGSDFRTPGLLSSHHNRKHNPRYHCRECSAAFGLWKDLERHTHTVHIDKFGPLRTFTCPNVGCPLQRKKFTRKDNFQRHIERCRLAVAPRNMVQE